MGKEFMTVLKIQLHIKEIEESIFKESFLNQSSKYKHLAIYPTVLNAKIRRMYFSGFW